MTRKAFAAFVLACAFAASGCGGSRSGQLKSGANAEGAAAPPHNLDPAALLAPTADEVDVLVHLSVVRAHPLGARLEPFILAWPGWNKTLKRFTPHPLAELDWIEVAGPQDAAKERMATRTKPDDAVIDGRLKGSADGTLRVVARPEPHLVTAVPPDAADALTDRLRGANVVDPPAPAGEAARATMPHPHTFISVVPEEARSAVAHVSSRSDGGAAAEIELTCDSPAAAEKVAASLRDQVGHVNGIMVKMLTHDLLSGLAVSVNGSIVKAWLAASRSQLEALTALAAGLLPQESAP